MHSPKATLQVSRDRDGLRDLLLTLAGHARHQLDLLFHRAETRLFDDPAFLQHLRQLCVGHHRNRVRLCVHETDRLAQQCPRLVDLCQRMPSRCQIRTPAPQHRELSYDLFIADQRHLIYRSRPHRYDAELGLDDPLNARSRQHQFEEVWELAEAAQGIRRLDL